MRKKFITTAIAVAALAGLAIPASADAKNGGHVRKVRMQDRCDPASFNAAFPAPPGQPPTCQEHNGELVPLDEFLAQLNPTDFGHSKWNMHPDMIEIRAGDSLSVSVRGGELHSFTKVDEFGRGCLEGLNIPLGLGVGDPAADCSNLKPQADGGTATAPGLPPVIVPAADLAAGHTYKFECLIHPWMRAEVTVRD